MSRSLHLFFALVCLYGLSFLIDVMTIPQTTEAERARAQMYIDTTNLPLPPHPFTHDGCTAWPDFLLWHDFGDACFAHDTAYWAGGDLDRKEAADLALYEDISHTGPLGPAFGTIMYIGVHYGGNNFISRQLGSNWGYGWNE